MSVEQVNIIVPSSPADRAALLAGIKEMSNAKTRSEGELEYVKESTKALSEKFNIDKKFITRMLTDYHKDQFDKKAAEADEYATLYEAVVNSNVESDDEDTKSGC